MIKADWIAVDWGTSNLRIWAMGNDGSVRDEKRSDQGMGSLEKNEFETVLLSHIEPWLSDDATPVFACGMVGARQGWVEAPYVPTPCTPSQNWVEVSCSDPRIAVRILSGVKQEHPADVMRGEETQIAGFLSTTPNFDGVLCLPGTHSKWAYVLDQKIQKFSTVLTGEVFSLLKNQSVLRHSILNRQIEWDDKRFLRDLEAIFEAPENFSRSLFSLRAKDLLESDQQAVIGLSASLIAAELASTKDMWQDHQTVVIGSSELVRLYQIAIQHLGGDVQAIQASTLTLEGLKLAFKEMNL